jgi:uncharacterized protein YcbK (DUF882 family)
MKYETVKQIEQIIDVRLLYILNVIRQFTGVPVIVSSGYRCPNHNKAIGGEPQSCHLYGQAADL